jgi:four helix bundle protein
MGRCWGGIVIEVYGIWLMVYGRQQLNNYQMISYKNLEVWKYSIETVKQIYILTKLYPSEERYGLVSQTRRAAASIPCNIAEGLGRNHKKDTIQFLHISRGSAYELEKLLCVALLTNVIDQNSYNRLNKILESNIKLITGFINYLDQKPSTINH